MSHHLHVDYDDQGRTIVHCLRCQVTTDGAIPADPCPHADVPVACCATPTSIVIEAHDAL